MKNPANQAEMSIETSFIEADLYMKQGLKDEAAAIYRDLLDRIGPSHRLAKEIEKRLNELDTQIPVTRKGLAKANRERLENALGLIEAGFYSEAVSELKGLLKTDLPPGEIHAKIGACYLLMDMPFDAIEHLSEALKDPTLKPDERLETLYRLSLTHERTGSIPLAIKDLEQIIRIDPGFRNAGEKLDALSHTKQKYGRFYYLVSRGALSEKDLELAKDIARRERSSIEDVILKQFGVSKAEIGRSLSEYYRCPFVEFNENEIKAVPSCIQGVKEHFFRTNICVPVKDGPYAVLVALDNPHDLTKIDNIRRTLKAANFEFAVSLKEDIDKFIDYFYGRSASDKAQKDVFEALNIDEAQAPQEPELDDAANIGTGEDNIVIQLVNQTIDDAYQKKASDIHIESLTGKRGALIRFRIDGDCMHYQTVPFNYKHALISRIKIMAGLDIAEKRLPQDGKIKFKTRDGNIIELRVATIPTVGYNEDAVLRLLPGSNAMPLDHLGILEHNLSELKRMIEMPYGLILVVGPTGSGKTTTLHAALGYINRPEKKIWTAEDPVEIVQEGLRQVQVKPSIGLDFARILRAFLRADPDVIMVGETRDEETAKTVIEASLTGHLVFSTLHTNSAPETVTRLLGMGMDPFNFGDALLGVLAQRLAKRLCPRCKEPYQPDEAEIRKLQDEYGGHPTRPLNLIGAGTITLYRAKGCALCNNTGYKGRLAIHELLVADDGLKELIQQKRPVHEIQERAVKSGMLTLKQDGILKVIQGDTDIRQVRAVCIR
ncbi:MAG: ATPase, T2SS/T4P/T4SS family [Dissulfurimicrobium hydrothermale]|uniref:ATPase, T2SS/T4P/T4SS family n=1 Tax=Dissulfurimicrobium hydrothermale TaxID=1750598 RepID=UPI003C72DA3E